MQLTAFEFAKLINDLKCDVRSGERRANPRVPTRTSIEVYLLEPAGASTVTRERPRSVVLRVRDLSRTGMGLLINSAVRERSRLLVMLPKTQAETLSLLCEAVRVQRLPGDMYHLGTQMIRRVNAEDLARFQAGDPATTHGLLDPHPSSAVQAA